MMAVCGSSAMFDLGVMRMFRTGAQKMRDNGNGGERRRSPRCFDLIESDKKNEGMEEAGVKRVMHKERLTGSGRRYL
jgi:hypothetical protein